jgi:hypothetical protein
MTVKDMLVSYMDGPELGIIAASYHCGLAMVPPAASIPQLYKQKLIDRMG